MKNLPEDFVNRMKDQLGTEADDFFNAFSFPSPTSIRLNHRKGNSSFSDLQQVPWCTNGFYLESRPRFHLDPHWHGGAYYVQEASSMILDDVITQLNLDQTPRIWLDLCAAPGGKTGIIASHLNPTDILIANEVVPQRKTILWENLVKGGYMNTLLTSEQASSFRESLADIILIDAPCAGEGMMRKEPEAINQWTEGLVKSCSLLQKQIVKDAVNALKPEGYLIYSTCSYSLEENIYNISDFNESYDLESIQLNFPEKWGIQSINFKEAIGYQLYPHKVKGEGLFIAVLKNNSNRKSAIQGNKKLSNEFIAVPPGIESILNNPSSFRLRKNSEYNLLIFSSAEEKAIEVLQKWPRAEIIAQAGQIKGKDFIPAHFMAMSGIQHSEVKKIELDLEGSLDYLERSTMISSSVNEIGWHLASYEGTILGWLKYTPQGWKNHYPMNWRLRSRNTF
ncbi:MAG: RNA methyltransferase [Saprospiraceae bacterium]|uniref:RNA methyltransferase n=1 Tax=Candidatus Opimibacter skivensis TaxID=2982028 RepID=A0A9D7STI9_9BACT|nr:RNA methyltransferase [Candidatus Opimibacter skivensis]